jgi:predicted Fe-Mo cluster-binding NifX family protein
MKIVVSAKGGTADSEVDPRFGRAASFLVYDTDERSWQPVDNVQALSAAHGAGIQSAETVCRLGASAVISGHVGPKAFAVLAAGGVKAYHTDPRTARAAVEAFLRGELLELHEADAI